MVLTFIVFAEATRSVVLRNVCVLVFSLCVEAARCYHMSSFVETKALEHLTKSPVEFVEYPWQQLLQLQHTMATTSIFCAPLPPRYIYIFFIYKPSELGVSHRAGFEFVSSGHSCRPLLESVQMSGVHSWLVSM